MYTEAAFRERIPKLNEWVARNVILVSDAALQYMDYLGENTTLFAETYLQLSHEIQEKLIAIANGPDRDWYLKYFSIPGHWVVDVKIDDGKVTLVKQIDGELRDIDIEYDHPVRAGFRALRQHLQVA